MAPGEIFERHTVLESGEARGGLRDEPTELAADVKGLPFRKEAKAFKACSKQSRHSTFVLFANT